MLSIEIQYLKTPLQHQGPCMYIKLGLSDLGRVIYSAWKYDTSVTSVLERTDLDLFSRNELSAKYLSYPGSRVGAVTRVGSLP